MLVSEAGLYSDPWKLQLHHHDQLWLLETLAPNSELDYEHCAVYIDHAAKGCVPQKIKYTPVIDEVEAEADDESSEVDLQEGSKKTMACMGTQLKSTP